jgi:hypothetical protein
MKAQILSVLPYLTVLVGAGLLAALAPGLFPVDFNTRLFVGVLFGMPLAIVSVVFAQALAYQRRGETLRGEDARRSFEVGMWSIGIWAILIIFAGTPLHSPDF